MSIGTTEILLLSQMQSLSKSAEKVTSSEDKVDSSQALLFALLLSSALSEKSGQSGIGSLELALSALAPKNSGSFTTYNQVALGLNDIQPTMPVTANAKQVTQAYALASKDSSRAEIEKLILSASKKYNVDDNLIREVIRAESGFDPKATSSAGAQGLMQLMPSTARGLGVTDSYDPIQNVNGGTKMLKGLLEQYNGDISLALAAYNAGSGAVAKYNGIPPYKETQNYVSKIMSRLNSTNTVV